MTKRGYPSTIKIVHLTKVAAIQGLNIVISMMIMY